MHMSPVFEDIVIPESLLSAAATSSQRGPNYPAYYSEEPTREIHVQKKRQPISNRQVYDQPPSVERRNWSHTSAFESWTSRPLPTVIEDPVINETPERQPSFFSSHPVSPNSPGHESRPPKSRVPNFSYRQPRFDVSGRPRVSSLWELYDQAKLVSVKLQRTSWAQFFFEYGVYFLFVSVIYFVLIGVPLWKGSVYWLYWAMKNKFVFKGGWSIAIGFMVIYTFVPLLSPFERNAPGLEYYQQRRIDRNSSNTALLIPCFKSAAVIGKTLEAALTLFPAGDIFVIANGDSPIPIDNTEEVCRSYGVNHIWSPIGSKAIALFIGCYAAKEFQHVLCIDDDCTLPHNFPVVVSRITKKVRCIGYTIKSAASNSAESTYCQQAQDLEYKMSGLQRAFAGKIGSSTFPHGAISLWDREFLKECFRDHPGFSISEDWFLGNSCRRMGGRIKMCSSVFVETTTPPAVFYAGGEHGRGGFGEMTVFKQRFLRWNFFFANGLYYNLAYIFGCWKLGWWEIGAKVFVFQEVYETIIYVLAPFILPVSLLVRPAFSATLLGSTIGLYFLHVLIFNEIHLRLKRERIKWSVLVCYYMPYKLIITLINVASCYWSLYRYARYFARRHPKIVEDQKAVEVLLKLEMSLDDRLGIPGLGRSMTVRTVGTRSKSGSVKS